LDWADAVIWLAALVGDGACAVDPAHTLAVNQDSILHLVQTFHGRILFPSTCSVYGRADDLLDEKSPLKPLSIYASTKLAAENLIKGADPSYAIFRLGTLYGMADRFSRVRFDLVVNAMTRSACESHSIWVWGGEQHRPLIHVRDAARIFVQQIDGSAQGTYNMARENCEIGELAHRIAARFEALDEKDPIKIEGQKTLYEDSRNYRVSCAKLLDLGVEHLLNVEHGVDEIRLLLKENRILRPHDSRYNNHEFLRKKSEK
jgi:nucleoside-diphosphate-sugar epimerase